MQDCEFSSEATRSITASYAGYRRSYRNFEQFRRGHVQLQASPYSEFDLSESATVALLYGAEAGVRHDLRLLKKDVKSNVVHAANHVKGSVNHAVKSVKDGVSGAAHKVQDKVDSARQKVADKIAPDN
ncbi:50S ribosomal protein L2 [Frankliniella fusca]|uniref:50S ribosomal protein L2 n=1 Tax=Frankliniella fusca TaxID=407009 RepID=A0AAE1H1A5_9NEOP|nr:50S ribosomal protein L2 [Frankliniella fusca]